MLVPARTYACACAILPLTLNACLVVQSTWSCWFLFTSNMGRTQWNWACSSPAHTGKLSSLRRANDNLWQSSGFKNACKFFHPRQFWTSSFMGIQRCCRCFQFLRQVLNENFACCFLYPKCTIKCRRHAFMDSVFQYMHTMNTRCYHCVSNNSLLLVNTNHYPVRKRKTKNSGCTTSYSFCVNGRIAEAYKD